MRILTILLVSTILLAGCRVYKVNSSANTQKIKGIPFLTKKVIFEQTTTYVQQFYDISGSIIVNTGPDSAMKSKTYVLPAVRVPANSKVLDKLQSMAVRYERWNLQDIVRFGQLYKTLIEEEPHYEPQRVGNIIERKLVMDEATYYLNSGAWASVLGNNEMSFELNDDNTLTKSTITQSSNVLEQVTGLLTEWIPGSDIIKSVLNIGEETVEPGEEVIIEKITQDTLQIISPVQDMLEDLLGRESIQENVFNVVLDLEGGIYRYDFTREMNQYQEKLDYIPFNLMDGFFTKKEIKKDTGKQENQTGDNENEDKKGIEFEGSISWPDSTGS